MRLLTRSEAETTWNRLSIIFNIAQAMEFDSNVDPFSSVAPHRGFAYLASPQLTEAEYAGLTGEVLREGGHELYASLTYRLGEDEPNDWAFEATDAFEVFDRAATFFSWEVVLYSAACTWAVWFTSSDYALIGARDSGAKERLQTLFAPLNMNIQDYIRDRYAEASGLDDPAESITRLLTPILGSTEAVATALAEHAQTVDWPPTT